MNLRKKACKDRNNGILMSDLFRAVMAHKDCYPNMCGLFYIAMTIAMTTVDVERGQQVTSSFQV